MKILYAAGTPLAGVAELMTRVVNEYAVPEHEARCLSRGTGLHSAWYRRPGVDVPWFNVRDKKQARRCVEWADVVHCMANVSARTMGMLHTLKAKVWVFQWHGAQIWPFKRVWLPEDYEHVRWIHIGQGWHRDKFFRQFDKLGLRVIPNLISIDDELHRPLPMDERRPGLVAFAPSNMKRGAVNDKGVGVVERACRGLKLDTIHGAKFTDCLARKRRAWVGIDEVVTPLYHRSGLEFLSQGVPCICRYDGFTRECLQEVAGTSEMPFINADEKNLGIKVRDVLHWSDSVMAEKSRTARVWMEKYYHPRDLIRRHLAVYTDSGEDR